MGPTEERWIMKNMLVVLVTLAMVVGASAQVGRYDFALANAPYSEASDFIDRLAAGSFSRATDYVADSARGDVTAQVLEAAWIDLLERYGQYQGNEVTGADVDGDKWHVHVKCTFQKAKVDAIVSFSTVQELGKVTGISFNKLRGNDLR